MDDGSHVRLWDLVRRYCKRIKGVVGYDDKLILVERLNGGRARVPPARRQISRPARHRVRLHAVRRPARKLLAGSVGLVGTPNERT